MNQYFKTLLALLIVTMVFGCTSVQPNVPNALESSFRELVAVDNMNKSFRIYVNSSDLGNLEYGSDIEIVFKNISGEEIFLPVDNGFKLYIIRNENWIEIKNNDEYYGVGALLPTKSQQKLGGRLVSWVRPVLPLQIDIKDQDILRILSVGELMSGDEKTGVLVGAFTDVFVKP